MQINGFQKLTLLDYPGKMACTIFTSGCNFRCPFCHNASLVLPGRERDIFEQEEILDYLQKRQGILEGVCVTGGEPLIQNGLEDFLEKVKKLGYKIKLDTNGSFPERLQNIIKSGLIDCVAMDIKNSKEHYSKTIGVENFDISPICDSVNILRNSSIDYEFRTTVTKELHSENDFEAIGQWLKGAKLFFLQNFVDSGDLIGTDLHPLSENELIQAKTILNQYIDKVFIRGE
jgi:pyruvate formate lyase activating enzyme